MQTKKVNNNKVATNHETFKSGVCFIILKLLIEKNNQNQKQTNSFYFFLTHQSEKLNNRNSRAQNARFRALFKIFRHPVSEKLHHQNF